MGLAAGLSVPLAMAVIFPQDQFQHILRILNTNVDGRHKAPFVLTAIKGVGRRFAFMVCKKAEVDLNKRAGELSTEEIDKIVAVIQNPLQFMPAWSSTGRRTSRMARPPMCMLTCSTPRCVPPSSASGKSAPTVVSVTAGVSVCVARRLAPPAVTVRLSVSPVRRGSKRWVGAACCILIFHMSYQG